MCPAPPTDSIDVTPYITTIARPLAMQLWSRALLPTLSVDDLAQAGAVALVQAGHRYDPDRGAFHGYARRCVRGAIIDAIRAMDPVPRCAHERARRSGASVQFAVQAIDTCKLPAWRDPEPDDFNAIVGGEGVDRLICALRLREDLSWPEIARAAGRSESLVRIRFARTCASIRRRLETAA